MTSKLTDSPYREWVDYYYFTPLIESNPHGKLNILIDIYKLKSDGVSTYDWYFYEIRTQTVPGKVAYGSNWRTADTWAWHYIVPAPRQYPPDYVVRKRWLVDYGPTTTVGMTTVTVTLEAAAGPEGPEVVYSYSWSYTIPDVKVHDLSDYSEHEANWWHDIDESKNVGKDTYQSKPGFAVKTKQNYQIFVDAKYEVQFAKPTWWGGWGFEKFSGTCLYIDAYEYGD